MKETPLRSEQLFYHPETGEVLNGLRQSLLSSDGRFEYPDPVPMQPPVNVRAPSGMRQLVQQMIREEMSQLAEAYEMETFEEADDFDVEDDPLDPLTDYEKVFDPKDRELSENTAAAVGAGAGKNTGSAPTGGGEPASPPSSSATAGGLNGNPAPQVTAGESSPRRS